MAGYIKMTRTDLTDQEWYSLIGVYRKKIQIVPVETELALKELGFIDVRGTAIVVTKLGEQLIDAEFQDAG